MASATLGKLLDRCQDSEIRLETNCAEIRDRTADNGVRMLTYYLARRRHHQKMALGRLDPVMLRRLRKVKLRSAVSRDLTDELRLPEFTPASVDGTTLIEATLGHDMKLMALYRSILEQPLKDDVRAVLEKLILVEERDIGMLKKLRAMRYF